MLDNQFLTKILATIGPASESTEVLARLVDEGARVFRINFSHGKFDAFAERIARIRAVSADMNTPLGILGDLSGPKIRLERVAEPFEVTVGDFVEISTLDVPSQRFADSGVTVLSTTYPEMVDDVEPGHRVFINDGAIRMLAIDKPHATDDGAPRLQCRVTGGGTISNRKGINLPDSNLTAPSLTDWDRECVRFAAEQDLDFLALSFVRRAADIRELRALLESVAVERSDKGLARLPIVAKIEKPEAIREIDQIVDEADAIMVARGDLGVEMEPTEVPILQKRIIKAAHDFGKPVIVATQMLESMIVSPTPTRAEVSDVANAIHEGADAVMLSGETAVGKFPIQAVNVMARTARSMEGYLGRNRGDLTRSPIHLRDRKYRTAALAHAVSVVVQDLEPAFVICWSELGGTARYLSQNRLSVPILAVSSNHQTLRKMSLLFGVTPVGMERPDDTVSFLERLDALVLERGWCDPGDPVVIVKGEPIGTPGVTNEIRIHYIGDVCRIAWHAKDD